MPQLRKPPEKKRTMPSRLALELARVDNALLKLAERARVEHKEWEDDRKAAHTAVDPRTVAEAQHEGGAAAEVGGRVRFGPHGFHNAAGYRHIRDIWNRREKVEKAGRLQPDAIRPVVVRRFVLDRHEDIHDNSGEGVVVEGVVFSDGRVAMRWRSKTGSTVLFDSVEDMLAVHGHEGRTTIRWLDEPGAGTSQSPRVVVKARQVQRPGVRGGKFYRTRSGKIRYGETPKGPRRPAWATGPGTWYFSWGRPVDMADVQMLEEEYGVVQFGNTGDGFYGQDMAGFGYIVTKKKLPAALAKRLGLALASWHGRKKRGKKVAKGQRKPHWRTTAAGKQVWVKEAHTRQTKTSAQSKAAFSYWHQDGLTVIPEKIAADVARAISERPSRATHGNTGKNAFFLVDGRIYPWNEWGDIPASQRRIAIAVHSHGGENWAVYALQQGKPEDMQPFNSADVAIWIKALKKRTMGPAQALIMPDGRMDILALTAATPPEFFNLGEKRLRSLLEPDYEERARVLQEKKAAGQDWTSDNIFRERLRDFARRYYLAYIEGARWRAEPSQKELEAAAQKYESYISRIGGRPRREVKKARVTKYRRRWWDAKAGRWRYEYDRPRAGRKKAGAKPGGPGQLHDVMTEVDAEAAKIILTQGLRPDLKPQIAPVTEYSPGRGMERGGTYIAFPNAFTRGSFGRVRIHLQVGENEMRASPEAAQLGEKSAVQCLKNENGAITIGHIPKERITRVETYGDDRQWRSYTPEEYLRREGVAVEEVPKLPSVAAYRAWVEERAEEFHLRPDQVEDTIHQYNRAELDEKIWMAREAGLIKAKYRRRWWDAKAGRWRYEYDRPRKGRKKAAPEEPSRKRARTPGMSVNPAAAREGRCPVCGGELAFRKQRSPWYTAGHVEAMYVCQQCSHVGALGGAAYGKFSSSRVKGIVNYLERLRGLDYQDMFDMPPEERKKKYAEKDRLLEALHRDLRGLASTDPGHVRDIFSLMEMKYRPMDLDSQNDLDLIATRISNAIDAAIERGAAGKRPGTFANAAEASAFLAARQVIVAADSPKPISLADLDNIAAQMDLVPPVVFAALKGAEIRLELIDDDGVASHPAFADRAKQTVGKWAKAFGSEATYSVVGGIGTTQPKGAGIIVVGQEKYYSGAGGIWRGISLHELGHCFEAAMRQVPGRPEWDKLHSEGKRWRALHAKHFPEGGGPEWTTNYHRLYPEEAFADCFVRYCMGIDYTKPGSPVEARAAVASLPEDIVREFDKLFAEAEKRWVK